MPCVAPTKLAHVVYRTRRFDEMLAWYQTVFAAKVQYANPGLAFLTFDDEHHRFAFVNLSLFQPEGTEQDRQGAIGVEFDPAEWLARLNAGAPESDFLVRQAHEPVSPIRGAVAQYISPR
jgi:catechol 2,3-dioxygenase-like lactoylglutathione lyase family enzyme